MCLLVVRPSNSNWLPSQKEFHNAWQSNPDGFGLAYVKRERVHVKKTLSEPEAWKAVQALPKGAPALMHWRYATHGSESLSNCHPFHLANIRSAYWVGAHNGILSKQACLGDKTDSESYLLGLETVDKAEIERDVAKLGYGKIALLSNAGELVIANEGDGEWRSGVWRSNSGMDDSPSWTPRGFGKRSHTAPSLHRLTCDYCDTLPLWSTDSGDLLCDACASIVEGGATW